MPRTRGKEQSSARFVPPPPLAGEGWVGAGGRVDPSTPSARPVPSFRTRGEERSVTRSPLPSPPKGQEAAPAYIARSASVTGSVAARSAGNSPPTKPIASAHFNPSHSSCGETRNSKLRLATPPARVEAV